MKKGCFLILALLFLLGCDDSETADPSLEAQLSGSWTKGLIKLQYFDASGKMEHERTVPHDSGMVYTFDRGQITVTDADGSGFVGTYRILEKDGSQQVQITEGYGTRYKRIVEISADKLVWESDFVFIYYLNQSWKTAAKAHHVEEFAR